MELKKDIESKLKEAFETILKDYIDYKNVSDWKNDKGFIDPNRIDTIVYWLIDKIKTVY